MNYTNIILSLLAFITLSQALKVSPKEENDYIEAVKGLVTRHFPKLSDTFKFEIIPKAEGDKDVYEIESKMATDKTVIIRGNNGVSLSAGISYYMRYHAHTQVTWDGDQLINAEPDRLPKEDFKERVESPLKYSYYMNTCTHSYSTVWWDWERWEREIDWMALKGINFPLAFTGQEYVWYKLFLEFGLDDKGIKDWLSGPAFFAWFRMGNLQRWGGPLSDKFMNDQHDLQVKILKRMREFGMMTILPMFTGFVPKALKDKYPDAKIEQGTAWSGFYEPEYINWNLDASDPLFNKIGKRFIELEIEIYGTDHYYNGDMFNEMAPKSGEKKFLEDAGKGTYDGLAAGDKDAIWVMQGWLFWNERSFWHKEQVQAYLSKVPNDKMVILDLYTEAHPVWSEHENYYGKNWIWCSLINFGGNPTIRGDVKKLLSQPHKDRRSQNSKMVGVGITMEAIDNNYIDYEATLEAKWRTGPPESADNWVMDYVHYRYGDEGAALPEVQEGWKLIHKNGYDQTGYNVSTIEKRPNFDGISEGINTNAENGLLDELAEGWGKLLDQKVVDKIGKVQTYIMDIAEIGTTCLEGMFNMLRADLHKWYKNKDFQMVDLVGFKMKSIIEDLDRLNSATNYTLLGKWIEDARKFGENDADKNLLELNARLQVTTWHTGVNNPLNDYARRSWSGLYKDYYLPRWSLFIKYVKDCVSKGEEFKQDVFNKDVFVKIEDVWPKSTNKYTPVAVGDAASIGQEIYEKYFKKSK